MPPVFFFSYAHANRQQDKKLDEFFGALSSLVGQKLGVPGEQAGFMDHRDLTPGVEWSPALAQALQTSDVLISLVSADYVASPYCGKEVQVFLDRRARHIEKYAGTNPAIVIPVIWMDMPRRPMPDVFQKFQRADALIPEGFAKGLRSLMMSANAAAFHGFVEALADAIVKAADLKPPLEGMVDALEFADVRNAFMPDEETVRLSPSEPAQVPDIARIVYVAAPQAEIEAAQMEDEQPPRRLRTNTANYGRRGFYWRPYHPPVDLKVGDIASSAIRGFEYKPASPAELMEELAKADATGEITILIVDPWTIRLPQYQKLMHRFDKEHTPNCCVIIPWNEEDEETRRLASKLKATITITFERLRANSNRFRYPVRSADALSESIREMLAGISMNITESLAARIELEGRPLAALSNTLGGRS
jgi:FxsC-like protein